MRQARLRWNGGTLTRNNQGPESQARSLDSPVGPLTVLTRAGAIIALRWQDGARDDTPLLRHAIEQLSAYFAGNLTRFDLPLRPDGSTFQQHVCAAMAAIPFGETRSYGDLARDLGVPAQAVGQGCGANPIPILIPCHRVLSKSGLGGFSGGTGLETKIWLLKHEGAAGLLI